MVNPDRIPVETGVSAPEGAGCTLSAAPRPLRFGGVEVGGPFWLAPMANYTNSPARIMARRLGASLVYTEMLAAPHLLKARRQYRDLTGFQAEERPIAAQMAPLEPDDAAKAARVFDEMGFDLIEINMACPAPKIIRRKRGGALMRDPERAVAIARAVAAATARPTLVKMRSGWSPEEGFVAAELAPRMVEAGAQAVVVHARYVTQLYRGRANWLELASVVEACPAPVIGSGDLATANDGLRMMRETGCAAVTFARGAIGNPWVFREAAALAEGLPPPPPPSVEEVLAVIRDHCRLSVELVSWRNDYHTLRRTLPKYAKRLRGAGKEMMASLALTRTQTDWAAWKRQWGFD